MLTYQTACLGSQFEHGQRRRVVHVKRCVVKFFYLIVELPPLVRCQLTALDFLARNFADVHNQTVYQLHVAHFKRKQGYGHFAVHRHVLGHGKHEGRLTHGRTSRNDNQVGVLPAGGHLVQLMESARKPTQTVGTCRRLLKHFIGFLDDRINLRVVLLHVLLRDFEEFSFGLLHQVVHVLRLIERLSLYVTRKRNQLTCQKLLGNDAGMVLNMSRRGYPTTQLSNIERSARLFQVTARAQLLGHGQNINRFLLNSQVSNGRINQLVPVFVERLRTKNLAHQRIRILLNHQRTQHSFFQFGSLRLEVAVLIHRLGLSRLCHTCISSRFCHFVFV